MKISRIATALLLSSAILVSCDKPTTVEQERVEFSIEKFSAYVGKPISGFATENSAYLMGSSAEGRVLLAAGTYNLDGTEINLNIFVNCDYAGNVNRILAQPVNQTSYGVKFWEHFTSDSIMPGLGSFLKSKYRTKSGELGECATLEEGVAKYEEFASSEPMVCAVCAPAGKDYYIVPLLQNNLGGLLVTATHTKLYYPDLEQYFYTTYESVRNEFFILGDVVETEDGKTVTMSDASDALDNPVTFVLKASKDGDTLSNIYVNPQFSTPEAFETFWRNYLENVEKLGIGSFFEAALIDADGKETETFTTQASVLTRLNQSLPAEGCTMQIRYALNGILYVLNITATEASVDVHRYSVSL